MTVDQAYKIIGVSQNSSLSQIEKAYKSKRESLQRQMIPGQPRTVREQAQRQIAELVSAWELLKNTPYQGRNHPPVHSQSRPKQNPVTSFVNPQSKARVQPGSNAPPPLSNRAVLTSFVVAASIILIIIIFCVGAFGTGKTEEPALLRVISYPWCYVSVDGKSFGPSGQAKAFELNEGRYKLTLQRNGKSLTKNIKLAAGNETFVKVQFGKGHIDVSQKKKE